MSFSHIIIIVISSDEDMLQRQTYLRCFCDVLLVRKYNGPIWDVVVMNQLVPKWDYRLNSSQRRFKWYLNETAVSGIFGRYLWYLIDIWYLISFQSIKIEIGSEHLHHGSCYLFWSYLLNYRGSWLETLSRNH